MWPEGSPQNAGLNCPFRAHLPAVPCHPRGRSWQNSRYIPGTEVAVASEYRLQPEANKGLQAREALFSFGKRGHGNGAEAPEPLPPEGGVLRPGDRCTCRRHERVWRYICASAPESTGARASRSAPAQVEGRRRPGSPQRWSVVLWGRHSCLPSWTRTDRNVRATLGSPEGAKHTSPGQRPG